MGFLIQNESKITYQNYIEWRRKFECLDSKKAQKDKKTSFLKETVENADQHKAVLNKTITTQEYCA